MADHFAEDLKLNNIPEEVVGRFTKFASKDPFPDIPPSLLNSADLYNYFTTTGLVAPFYPSNLKQASYGIKLSGEYIYWKNTSTVVEGILEDLPNSTAGRFFTLEKNSIAFLQLEPTFRFPDYIAARFNLKIKHIYQGLLLGTGPIIDPGFEGRLFLPLHNLTNNDYKINIDTPLIWMEFTKLSPNKRWDERLTESSFPYRPFNKEKLKTKQSLRDYLAEAHPNGPIVSTIVGFKEEIDKTKSEAESLVKDGKSLIGTFNLAIIVALFGIAVTLCIGLRASFNNQVIYQENIKRYEDQVRQSAQKILDSEERQNSLVTKIKSLEDRLNKYELQRGKSGPKEKSEN